MVNVLVLDSLDKEMRLCRHGFRTMLTIPDLRINGMNAALLDCHIIQSRPWQMIEKFNFIIIIIVLVASRSQVRFAVWRSKDEKHLRMRYTGNSDISLVV